MPRAIMRTLINGDIPSAIWSYLGPVQTAWGITSPKNNTAVTEIITAHTEGTILSKKIGSASMAVALESNNVTNK